MQRFSLLNRIRDPSVADLAPGEGVVCFTGRKPPLIKVVRHSSRFHREERPTNSACVDSALRTLIAFVRFMKGSGIKWYLCGGIALDLLKGESLRQHGDVDIVLPIDQAAALKYFLAKRDTSTYRRVCTTTYSADNRVTIFRRCTPGMRDFGNCRTLKLFMGPRERLLNFIDLHFVTPNKQGCAVLSGKKIIDLPIPLRVGSTIEILDEKVAICDARLMLFLKCDANPRNFLDAGRIASELPVAEVKKVLALKAKFDAATMKGCEDSIAGRCLGGHFERSNEEHPRAANSG